MMFEFSQELGMLNYAIGITVPKDKELDVAMLFAKLIDRGIALEQKRIIEILKAKAVNPRELVAEIRKPIR